MNKNKLQGNWKEQKGKLMQKFAFLSDDDLMYDEGKQDEMPGKLQVKLGKTRQELHDLIKRDSALHKRSFFIEDAAFCEPRCFSTFPSRIGQGYPISPQPYP